MEFDELLITTGVDALVRLVKQKSKVELEEASKTLNIPSETIEDWSRVLEEEGILRIEYRLTKVYLVWIKPTEEEITEKEERIITQKREIADESDQIKERMDNEREDLKEFIKSFNEFYTKTASKLEKVEKELGKMPSIPQEDGFKEVEELIEKNKIEVEQLNQELEELRNELKGINIEGIQQENKKSIEKTEDLVSQIEEIKKKISQVKTKTIKNKEEDLNLPSVAEIKKKFDQFKKEFLVIRTKGLELKEDLRDAIEGANAVKEVFLEIDEKAQALEKLREEMAEVSQEALNVTKRVDEIAQKIEENKEVLDRFDQTYTNAKGAIKRLDKENETREKLEEIEKEQAQIDEKVEALAKIIDAVSGNATASMEFEELNFAVDDKLVQIKKELDSIANSLEEEKSTYFAYQKIREKIAASIETFEKRIEKMKGELDGSIKEALNREEEIEKEGKSVAELLKKPEMKEIITTVNQIKEKQRIAQEIKDTIDELSESSENLNKKITLIAREAKLLSIRKEEGSTEPTVQTTKVDQEKKEEIKKQIDLTKEEELEYRKKREELKKLIKKLWENEGK